MATTDRSASEGLARLVGGLRDAAEEVALRLSGDDSDADLEELGQDLAKLRERATKLTGKATGTWKTRLNRAVKHFHEACDLLDDGEPADAVALEVMAGREELRR